MGLDMYLTRKVYIGNKFRKEGQQVTVNIPENDPFLKDIETAKIDTIEVEEMYLRKQNHIHRWFVDNVQDGEDDCRTAYVSTDDLELLYNICVGALKKYDDGDVEGASVLLPTQEGFFFGSTDYDEYYRDGIEETIEQLKPIIEREARYDYYYTSSW